MKSLQSSVCVVCVRRFMAAFIHLCLAKDRGASLIPSTSSVAMHKLNSTSTHSPPAVINCFSSSLNFPRSQNLSAPDQCFSSYKALWDLRKLQGIHISRQHQALQMINHVIRLPHSPNLSSWSKVIITRQE